VPLEGMAAAVRDGTLSFSFLDATAFDRFAGLTDTTFRQLSARTGIPLDLLKVVREAVGFAEPRPEDHVREDELSVVPAIELQLSTGFRRAVIEWWLRADADSLRRVAETETDWWMTEVGPGWPPFPSRPSSPSSTGSRNTPGARVSSRTSSSRWNGPVCTVGCTVRRRSASLISPGTPD
jgi:hypothetical protein